MRGERKRTPRQKEFFVSLDMPGSESSAAAWQGSDKIKFAELLLPGMRKYSVSILIFILLFIVGLVFVFFPFLFAEQSVQKENRSDNVISSYPETIKNSLDLKNERSDLLRAVLEFEGFSLEVFLEEGSTVYDLMEQARLDNQNFSFSGKEFPGLGFFVEEINGLSQNPEQAMYWIYYVNGEAAAVGASQYKIKNNDIITWQYEKSF